LAHFFRVDEAILSEMAN